MARAHLPVDVELAAAFLQAQSVESKVSWIACTIKGEAVCLVKAHEGTEELSDTVDSLKTAVPLSDEQPAFVLIARERTPTARRWQLLNWAPDCAPPRLKMLYSSSREDLKQSLGAGFFASHRDYSAFDSDLTGASLLAAEQPKGDAPLTDAERLENEERTRPAFSRCAGMASVPFELSDECSTALAGLATGLVEVVLGANETLELAQSVEETSRIRDALSALDAPRFVVVKRSEKAVLVFYCPDSAPIKQKMTYSTAKQTFSALVSEKGIQATLVDCRDASELDSSVADVLEEAAAPEKHVPLVHKPSTRPSRPGRRGSSRVKKFVSDSSVVEAIN
jgi:twinfilin-like protein